MVTKAPQRIFEFKLETPISVKNMGFISIYHYFVYGMALRRSDLALMTKISSCKTTSAIDDALDLFVNKFDLSVSDMEFAFTLVVKNVFTQKPYNLILAQLSDTISEAIKPANKTLGDWYNARLSEYIADGGSYEET